MRSCPVCGTSVGDTDDFCGNCGTYLGWGQEETAAPAPPKVVGPSPQAPVEPEQRPAAAPPAPGQQAAAGPGQPVAAEEVVAVQPAKPVAPRPTRTAPAVAPVADGSPCPRCGTPNPAGRRFCLRCAAPLTEAAATPEPPWWRKVRLPRRRGGSGALGRRLVALALLTALVIAGVALYPLGERLVQDVLDKTSKPVPVAPAGAVAGAEAPGHPAAAAVDGVSNRYWGAPGPGAWIEFAFDRPIRLLAVVVHTGPSARQEEFATQARPTSMELVATTSGGTVHTVPMPLADHPGPQQLDTAISDVVRVRLVVRTAAGLEGGKHVALGEVEFFRRS